MFKEQEEHLCVYKSGRLSPPGLPTELSPAGIDLSDNFLSSLKCDTILDAPERSHYAQGMLRALWLILSKNHNGEGLAGGRDVERHLDEVGEVGRQSPAQDPEFCLCTVARAKGL